MEGKSYILNWNCGGNGCYKPYQLSLPIIFPNSFAGFIRHYAFCVIQQRFRPAPQCYRGTLNVSSGCHYSCAIYWPPVVVNCPGGILGSIADASYQYHPSAGRGNRYCCLSGELPSCPNFINRYSGLHRYYIGGVADK